jgi:hypothetical protein
MNRLALLAAAGTLFVVPALAQDRAAVPPQNQNNNQNTQNAPRNPAIKDPNANVSATPVAGANSFTMGQAQSAIEKRGFTQVSGLTKDSQGVWRGTAMKDGRRTPVSVDYQGNVN